MKRLRIEHQTGYRYHDEVTASYNEARMLPGTTDSQFVLTSALEIEPAASVTTYVDYFGTRVSAFDVLTPHSTLSITARSLVEVRPRPIEHTGMRWDRLDLESERSVETMEHRAQTARTAPHPEVTEIARSLAARHPEPGRAAHEICLSVGEAVEYVYGVTGVHSTAADAWQARKGVCQDMVHIGIGALRSVGIPARYVSGYLHPHEQAEIGIPVPGESHAWLEWFAGVWTGFDLTNGTEIGDRHVMVGRGRDYGDVPPLRGVYAGPVGSDLTVQVTLTREA